jgi:hypothetical protein
MAIPSQKDLALALLYPNVPYGTRLAIAQTMADASGPRQTPIVPATATPPSGTSDPFSIFQPYSGLRNTATGPGIVPPPPPPPAPPPSLSSTLPPPEDRPLISASDFGGTPVPPDPYNYGSLYRPPAAAPRPAPTPIPPQPASIPPPLTPTTTASPQGNYGPAWNAYDPNTDPRYLPEQWAGRWNNPYWPT